MYDFLSPLQTWFTASQAPSRSRRIDWHSRLSVEQLDARLAPAGVEIGNPAFFVAGFKPPVAILSMTIPLVAQTPAIHAVTAPILHAAPQPAFALDTPFGMTAQQSGFALQNIPNWTTLTEGETLTFAAAATLDGVPARGLTFSLEAVDEATFPKGTVIDPQTGVVTVSPSLQPGVYIFRVRVTDGVHSAEERVNIRVRPAPDSSQLPAPAPGLAQAGAAAFLGAALASEGTVGPTPKRQKRRTSRGSLEPSNC
jgi:Putative Ig domain